MKAFREWGAPPHLALAMSALTFSLYTWDGMGEDTRYYQHRL